MEILGIILGASAIFVTVFVWWYKPEHVKSWFRNKSTHPVEPSPESLIPPAAVQPPVQCKPEPYRSRSVRVDEDPVTAGLAADLGGISGPSLPRMVVRYDVPQYEGTGWEIIRFSDGRECVWTGKVSDGNIQECVLMAKKPILRQPPPAVGFRRCYYCGKDSQVPSVPNSDLSCGFCGQLSKHMT